MKYILILLLSISQCFALDITPIKKGESAPNDGFYVDAANMKEFRKINEKKKLLERQNLTLKDLADINNDRVNVYRERSTEAEKRLTWEHTKGNVKGVGGFLVGVLATSLAVFAAVKVAR